MNKTTLMFCCASLLSFHAISQDLDPKLRAKQSLALRAAAQEVRQVLNQQATWTPEKLTAVSTPLSQAILENTPGYQQKEKGKSLAHAWLIQWRLADFDTQKAAALNAAQLQSPLPLSEADVLKRVGTDWQNQARQGAVAFADAALDQVYAQARESALIILKQQLISSLVYPSQAAVDQALGTLNKKQKDPSLPLTESEILSAPLSLTHPALPFENLLEELSTEPALVNQTFLKQLAKQYQHQIALATQPLQAAPQTDLWTATDMQQRMIESLNASPQANVEAHPPVYDVFESVIRWTEMAAAQWEQNKIAALLKQGYPGQLSQEVLEQWMTQDLSQHLILEESITLLHPQALKTQTPLLTAALVQQAPASRQSGLQSYYLSALQTDEALGTFWQNQLTQTLRQQLPPLRQKLAQQQLNQQLPFLQPEAPLPESVLLWFADQGLSEATTFSQLNDAFELPENPEPMLLTETKSLALQNLNAKVQPALQSYTAQIQIIRELETENMDDLKAAVAQGQDADTLYTHWLQLWQSHWQLEIKNQDPLWQDMMPRTENELRKSVRQWYEAIEKTTAEQQTTAASEASPLSSTESPDPRSPEMTLVEVPLEPVSDPQGSAAEEVSDTTEAAGEKKEDAGITQELENFRGKSDGVLAFSDLGNGDCRLLFGAPDGKGALSIGFDPENVDASAQKIADALRGPLRDVLNGTDSANEKGGFRLFSRAKEPTLSMLFQVDSPKIRHQMSIQVRQRIQSEIDAWAAEKGQTAPTLLWQDEMGVWEE
ncbi:hypothetical protein P3T73_13515 [Kiritimatiellota bacterium B12222]|nr:hypothetical protein P3T73_13515 [Kiritimatiellota bacterium B12222]